MSVTYRTATAKDVEAYYGGPVPVTIRAMVVCVDEEPKAIVGISRWPDHARYFSEYKPEFEPYMKTMPVLRAIKKSMQWVEKSPMLVLAVADNPPLLERLGFAHLHEDVYVWPH